jgi:hypothetical protein
MSLTGRLPTTIQGLQFRYQRSWKCLVRSPKAASRTEHGTDTRTAGVGWQALPGFVHVLMIDVAAEEILPEDLDC